LRPHLPSVSSSSSFLLLLPACTILANMKSQKPWQKAASDTANYATAIANKTGFVLKGRTKKFFLLAESDSLAKTWLTAIKTTTKEWEALLEKAGVSEEQRKDAGTTKFVQQFLQSDSRARSKHVSELSKVSSRLSLRRGWVGSPCSHHLFLLGCYPHQRLVESAFFPSPVQVQAAECLRGLFQRQL